MTYKIINDPRLNIHGQLYLRTVGTIGKPYVCEQPYLNTRKSKLIEAYLRCFLDKITFYYKYSKFSKIT
jgi:hypothetical protein